MALITNYCRIIILVEITNVKFSKLFSQNAWTNPGIDTRNVAVHDFILLVEDVPDSPPYFLIAPPVTRLPETARQVEILNTIYL